jgi:hypothetical protein
VGPKALILSIETLGLYSYHGGVIWLTDYVFGDVGRCRLGVFSDDEPHDVRGSIVLLASSSGRSEERS